MKYTCWLKTDFLILHIRETLKLSAWADSSTNIKKVEKGHFIVFPSLKKAEMTLISPRNAGDGSGTDTQNDR